MATQFANIRAEAKVDSGHLRAKMSFIQWQLTIVGAAVVGFLGIVGYGVKKLLDVYIPQASPRYSFTSCDGTVSSATTQGRWLIGYLQDRGNDSGGAANTGATAEEDADVVDLGFEPL
ncbi:hypothetical protein HOY80DRAFT_999246 [Tuber brumale]|nr:hypothetical protein HOY80DRAFT_999246 [Tuber brumale]